MTPSGEPVRRFEKARWLTRQFSRNSLIATYTQLRVVGLIALSLYYFGTGAAPRAAAK
jgi:hypothetical protein